MIFRLGLVVYWLGLILGVLITFAVFYVVNSSPGRNDLFLIGFGMSTAFALFGVGWILRFVLTGISRIFP